MDNLKTGPKKRFWEIDFLRGTAIIMMIIFHLLYDINYFSLHRIEIYSEFWQTFAHITAMIFIFLVGVSLTISFSRIQTCLKERLYVKYLLRGLKIFCFGLLITLVTWIFLKDGFIMFGVLHFIGISIIMAYPFLRFRFLNLVLGIVCILFGLYIANFTFSFPWLLWLGFRISYFYTLDYFPVFPWFGIILFGIFFGNLLYRNNIRNFSIHDFSCFFPVKLFRFLGRHSLLIYLIHQPILIAIIWFFV